MKSINDIDLSPDISFIANFRKESNVLRFGRMFMREISTEGIHFKLSDSAQSTLAFSRILYDQEVLFVFNSSRSNVKQECIMLDSQINKTQKWMNRVYGIANNVEIQHSEDPANPVCFKHLYLRPMQLVVLKNH